MNGPDYPCFELYRVGQRWRWCWRDERGIARLRSHSTFITRNAGRQHVSDLQEAMRRGDVEARPVTLPDGKYSYVLVWVGEGPCTLGGLSSDPLSN